MECKKIDIAKLYDLEGVANLEVFKELEYLDTGRLEKMPAMVVVPGGGYGMVSKREGLPVAIEYLNNGFIPFVLTYSVGEEYCYPQQLLELAASVDYIRKNADDFGVDVDKIYVVGFSAGGHLVANLGAEYLELQDKYNAKPNVKNLP